MTIKGKTWSCGTNSRLPFGVNVNLNLSIIASPTVKDTVIMVKFKYTCVGAFTFSHIFQYSPSTIVNFVVTDNCISFCFPFKFCNFDLFNIELFHFIHPLHILVVSDEPSTIDH